MSDRRDKSLGIANNLEIKNWQESALAALRIIENLEDEEFEAAIQKATDATLAKQLEAERQIRKDISVQKYSESFEARLILLANFANREQMPDKVEHIFSTILNGVRSAVEIDSEFIQNPKKFDEMKPALRERFAKNRITVQEGRHLILRAVKFILALKNSGHSGWDKAPKELMEIWDKQSKLYPDPSRPTIAWSGGGELTAMTLGENGNKFDPFVYFGLREPRQ